jgi:hypothetical protein
MNKNNADDPMHGVLGSCICLHNEEDYMRPCPVHFPSTSERELAQRCLKLAGLVEFSHEIRRALADAAAVIDRQVDRQDKIIAENFRLRGFLRAISEGRGRYSLDHHEHAKNTIADMKKLALDAIAGKRLSDTA